LSPEIQQMIIRGVEQEAAGRSIVELERQRDQAIIGLLALRKDLA
jgi:hypothetical protein